MKRVQEKIKDLIEARSFETIKNYQSDAAQTVAAYRFTDATSDLLGKWLDEIAALAHRSNGVARALAGNRGVGKSHLLSVLSFLAAQPELRTSLSDSHVAASAQNLPRREVKVVRVERGTGATLTDELRDALVRSFSEAGAIFGATVSQMLATAAVLSEKNAPLVVVIDSAANRAARIKRDDGAVLGEMADAARAAQIFLVVALDDDITGADGVNVAITRTFQIDFLDQEHLYRVLDTFIFQKKPAARIVLKELYQSLRATSPGFNWSEPRFNALYPIHPVVADVTPAVRHYAQNFAFLPFAAESGGRALNRPAHSLIALDEIFDRAEPELRKSTDLAEAFAVYDELASNAVAQIPVMQRLQAKLVLKGLFILSLDGRGASAREIAAAMLIYDEAQPAAAVAKVEEMLQTFLVSETENRLGKRDEADEARYVIGISASAEFETKLTELAAKIAPAGIEQTLRTAARLRFPDWIFGEDDAQKTVDFSIHWRGTLRRGRIVWNWFGDFPAEAEKPHENLDWEILITRQASKVVQKSDLPSVVWQPAALKPEEELTIRRYAALVAHANALDDEFGEAVEAARQTHAAHLERIWTRTFLDDGAFVAEGEISLVSSETKAAKTLESALGFALLPIFDRRFPAHPNFAETLTAAEVSTLTSDFFGASESNAANVQKLAENFLAPLNLVAQKNNHFVLEPDAQLLRQPLIGEIWRKIEAADGAAVPMAEIGRIFKAAPHGLTREAQHLVLAALVARRRVEFVTRTNERINRRILDLKIIWADVAGVVRSSVLPRTQPELTVWARLLTNRDDLPAAFEAQPDAIRIQESLAKWLADWKEIEVLTQFDRLPDEVLNVRAWRLAAHTARTFGAAAEAIEALNDEQITLEDALERIIEAFHDSPEQIANDTLELEELKIFVRAAARGAAIWRYVALAEATDNQQVEAARREVVGILTRQESLFSASESERLESLWLEFQERYAAAYVARHDGVINSPQRPPMLEKLAASADWAEFEGLSALPVFHEKFWAEADELRRRATALRCGFDVRAIIREKPVCACGFRMANAAAVERLPHELARLMTEGRRNYRKTLSLLAAPLAAALKIVSQKEPNRETAARAAALSEKLLRGGELPMLAPADVAALKIAALEMQPASLQVRTPRSLGAAKREDLRGKLNEWLDNLPDAPFSFRLTDGE